jgi:hypothetical protein
LLGICLFSVHLTAELPSLADSSPSLLEQRKTIIQNGRL